ncbi:hypothetical protein BC830DRAFT_800621 [Chytriomyces sp. MP71]|nr:hypothetical protein BC830DRAFT_800621 [Chytriomyces sp. MP71]
MSGAMAPLEQAEDGDEAVAVMLAVHDHSIIGTCPLERCLRSLPQSCETHLEASSTSSSQRYQLPDQFIVASDNLLSPVTQVPPKSPASANGSMTKELPRPKACAPCKNSHVVCGNVRPCARCARQGRSHECMDPLPQKRGRPRNDPDRVGAPRDPNKPRLEPKRRRKADRAQDNTGNDIKQPVVPRRRPSKWANKLPESVQPTVTTPTSTAMQSPSATHIDAFQLTSAAITPFSTFSPTPADLLPYTPGSIDSNIQTGGQSLVHAVNWTEVDGMLFPGPEISQACNPELSDACSFVLAGTEIASPTSSSAATVPSRQLSPELTTGLERLDTVLDGLLAEINEAGQSGITLPAHDIGHIHEIETGSVELEGTDVTCGNLDEMFDANGNVIVTADTEALSDENMDTPMAETQVLGQVLLRPYDSVCGTLETMLDETVPTVFSGYGKTVLSDKMDTTMANEDYLFAHIFGIAESETQATVSNFTTVIAENEGLSMTMAHMGIDFLGAGNQLC